MKLLYMFLIFRLSTTFTQFLSNANHYNNSCSSNYFKAGNVYPTCYTEDNGYFLLCYGGLDNMWKYGSNAVRILTLCHWPDNFLDPQILLQKFPFLGKLTIANSNLTKLTEFPSEAKYLEKIEITNTTLAQLPKDCFKRLPFLKSLDLRNNTLVQLNPNDVNSSSVEMIFLFGNQWRCNLSMEWILDTNSGSLANKIIDKEKLQCFEPYKGRSLILVLEVIKSLNTECQKSICECQLVYVVPRSGRQIKKELMAFATMNCSYKGFDKMPLFLPENTSTLHLTGNKITDLSPLKTNPFYRRVIDLYLDDNLIESISLLDGTYWLEHFRLLSLRGNKLTHLPTYALENILLYSTNAVSLYLGNNPWRCDCLFTPAFQEMLIRYPNLVKDVNDVKCSFSEHDKNSNKQIRDLTRTEICVVPGDHWIHPLDVLNIILVLLIIFVLGKLLYDYRLFKKSGTLPWIVSKIP